MFPSPPRPLPPQFFQAAGQVLYTLRDMTSGCLSQCQGTRAFPLLIWQTTVTMEKDLGVKSRAWGSSQSSPRTTVWVRTRRVFSVGVGGGGCHRGLQALHPICVACWVAVPGNQLIIIECLLLVLKMQPSLSPPRNQERQQGLYFP